MDRWESSAIKIAGFRLKMKVFFFILFLIGGIFYGGYRILYGNKVYSRKKKRETFYTL